jgi:FixJ family two-component response regulator
MNASILDPIKGTQSEYVLLVEDNKSLCSDLERMLTFCGYTVFAYSDPKKLLDNFPNVVPAVLVTDMRMPNLSGIELQESLTKKGRLLPIIFISGESSDHQIVAALKNGALDFLLKPFTRESFLAAVAKGIEVDTKAMKALIRKTAFLERKKVLSPRECQVFELLAKGLNNNEIMETLKISLPTAKQYKSEVMQKLEFRSLAELIKLYNETL